MTARQLEECRFLIDDREASRMPATLRIPIAAENQAVIEQNIGPCQRVETRQLGVINALRVHPWISAPPDPGHPVMKLPGAERLFGPVQYWVHVDYASPRPSLDQAMPDVDIDGMVCDHILHRLLAREHHLTYLRVCPVWSAVINSGEWGLERFQVDEYLRARHQPFEFELPVPTFVQPVQKPIVYAGPFAICKMLNRSPGTRHNLFGVRDIYWKMQEFGIAG